MNDKHKVFMTGAKAALPICLGLIPIGISYGLLALQAGLTQFETVLMSVLVMAGSSQLMVVGMIGKATVLAMVTAVFFVNLRHLVMSSAVMSRMEPTPLWIKLLSAFSLCDESFALFSLSGSLSAAYLLGANTALYGTWVLASVLGAVIGQSCRRWWPRASAWRFTPRSWPCCCPAPRSPAVSPCWYCWPPE